MRSINDYFTIELTICVMQNVSGRACGGLSRGFLQHRTRPVQMLRHSSNTDDAPSSPPEEDDDDILIEKQMLKKRKGKSDATKKPYDVVSATRDSVYGDGPQSSVQQFETNVVGFLGLLFVVILLEGIFLGASGFLSEEADQFAQDVVYPLFSPTLGLFLAGSTAYGLWKTKERPEEKK